MIRFRYLVPRFPFSGVAACESVLLASRRCRLIPSSAGRDQAAMLKRCALVALLLLGYSAAALRADPGLLVPTNLGGQPDPKVLSLDRMDVDVVVSDRFAR